MKPGKDWTLFLDRDGVINERLPGDYVSRPEDFVFIKGALEAICALSAIFGRIIVVTNQQGIGKGKMTAADLEKVHAKMVSEIEAQGGRIDAVYFCGSLSADKDPRRKPGPGMALDAQRDFPEIDFQRSVMVGDSHADMEFGFHLGMVTVLVDTKAEEKEKNKDLKVDYRVGSLEEWAFQSSIFNFQLRFF